MPDTSTSARRGGLQAYILCYALYIALVALAYGVLFVIWRRVIIVLVGATIGAERQSSAAYLFPMFLMGIGMFVLIMGAEPYLRTAIPRGQLLPRFGRIAIPLAVAGVAGLLLQALLA